MIDIKNGVLVYKVWPDGSNELLAHMCYQESARLYIRAYIADHQPLTFKMYLVNTYDGKLEVFPEGR